MHDPLAVRVVEGQQRLAHDLSGLRGLEPPVAVQQRPKALATDELHDHVVDAVDRAPVEDGHDVGVGEAGRTRFGSEPVDERLVAGEGPVEHLDRDLASEDRVAGAEDLAHAARGDALHDGVASIERDDAHGLAEPPRAPAARYSRRDALLHVSGKRSRRSAGRIV